MERTFRFDASRSFAYRTRIFHSHSYAGRDPLRTAQTARATCTARCDPVGTRLARRPWHGLRTETHVTSCPNPLWPWYPAFETWREKGGLPADRPKNLPAHIPQGAWDCYRERHPPKPKPAYWQNGKPGVFVTTGWTIGFGPTQRKLSAPQLVAEL